MFQFEKYSFPKLGFIKVPKVNISKSEESKYNLQDGYSSEDYLTKMAYEKFKEKINSGYYPKENEKGYKDRLDYELSEIKKLKFTDYILLIDDVIKFCSSNNILNGVSRGSCGGSLLLSCLGIVKLDPIKHKLLFERFISSARTETKEIDGETYISSESLPDFDLDSAASKKPEINKYLNDKFPNRTLGICNFSTLQSKALIKEVLKIYENFNEDQSKLVSEMIETNFGKVQTIEESLKNNEQFSSWAKNHEKTVEIANKLSGLIKNVSVHASGIFLGELDVDDCVPVILSSDKKKICGYDMSICPLFGIKLDNLGLKNLDIIKEIIDQIGISKIEDINIEDESIYKFLRENDNYYGIFQAEDGLGKSTLQKIKPNNIEDISLSLSLGRPGSVKYIDDAVKVKNGEADSSIHPEIDEILKDSYSVIAWQEQIMKISQIMAGFSPKQADRLRKGIGKKIKSVIQELRPLFIEGAIKNGFEKDFSEKIFQVFEDAGDYSFNRCLSPDTVVETRDGYKPMFECKIGEFIKSYDVDNKKDHFVEIKNTFQNKVELFEVELENGKKIKSSINHKFLTKTHGMITLYEILKNNFEIATYFDGDSVI